MPMVDDLLKQGMQRHNAGELPAAQLIYERALQLEPRNATAWYLLGVAAYQTGNRQVAIERLQGAVALDPKNAEFYKNLAAIYQDSQEYDKVRLCYGRIIQLDVPPGNTEDYIGMAGDTLEPIPGPTAGPEKQHGTALYVELMKRCLTNAIYEDASTLPNVPATFNTRVRSIGADWPSVAHTMIGRVRLENVQYCVEDVLARGIPGDLLEAGVWRGGTVIFMRALLQAYGVRDRQVWVADSFEGVPPPNPEKYPQDAGMALHTFRQLAVSQEQVQENFRRYDLADGQVHFLKGWFRDTLSHAPVEQLALLRIDGDLYESTMDVLQSLYPKLARGGYVILDDFVCIEQVRQAAMDYRARHQITDPIRPVDWSAAYWQRS